MGDQQDCAIDAAVECLQAGGTLIDALAAAGAAAGEPWLMQSWRNVQHAVLAGVNLAAALEAEPSFTPDQVAVARVLEECASGAAALQALALLR